MPIRRIFNVTDRLLERALDGVSQRQRVTAHNIANADTPGYKRFSLSFEEQLRAALSREPRPELIGRVTHPSHIPFQGARANSPGAFVPRRVDDTTMRNDGNNVDIEAEMAQITKDQILYNALVGEVSKRYGLLRDAITEGRR